MRKESRWYFVLKDPGYFDFSNHIFIFAMKQFCFTHPKSITMIKTILPLVLFALSFNQNTQTAEQYHRDSLEKSGYAALIQINKAIELDPTSLEYRKFRAKNLMERSVQEKDLLLAIDDLIYVAENGEEHFRIYTGIMNCYLKLGNTILSERRPKIKKDEFGDNSAYNAAYKEILQKRVDYLRQALSSLKKSEERGYEKRKADLKRNHILKKIGFLKMQMQYLMD